MTLTREHYDWLLGQINGVESLRDWRADMLRRGRRDSGYAKSIREMCTRDPLFFFATMLWLYEPRGKGEERVIPFLPWEHQEPVIMAMERDLDEATEEDPRDSDFLKSRGEGASYCACGVVARRSNGDRRPAPVRDGQLWSGGGAGSDSRRGCRTTLAR